MNAGAVYSEQAQCQDCYKCVRACPVKAIRVSSSHAVVMPERCLACGECVSACPSGAKRVRDDVGQVQALLGAGRPVVVSLAPSFRSEFEGLEPGKLIAALRLLGFQGVSETALGAQQVSARLARILDAETGRLWISTACPVAVDFVRTYAPQWIGNLTPLESPLLAHVRLLEAGLGKDVAVVFIGPCIAKKLETERAEALAAALTFQDLRAWMDRAGIDPGELQPEAGDRFLLGSAEEGAFYPVAGGMAQATALSMTKADTRFVTLCGLGPIRDALGDLPGPGRGNLFLELLACEGGCVCGPRSTRRSSVRARMRILDSAAPGGPYPRSPEPAPACAFLPRTPSQPRIPADQMTGALRRLGKEGPGDELNCGACGYDSCRELAAAILGDLAETRMCVSNLRRLAEKKANALLRTLPYGVVIVDEELRIIESNDQFVGLLGAEALLVNESQPGLCGARVDKLVAFGDRFREVLAGGGDQLRQNVSSGGRTLSATLFTVEQGRVVGALLLDVTKTEDRHREIIAKAEEVIQNMLGNAQEIAFSLGRNAARSEGILNSIIAEFRGPGPGGAHGG